MGILDMFGLGGDAQGGGLGIGDRIRAQYAPGAYAAQHQRAMEEATRAAMAQQQGANGQPISPEMATAFGRNPQFLHQFGSSFMPQSPTVQESGTDPLTGQKMFSAVTHPGMGMPSMTQLPNQPPGTTTNPGQAINPGAQGGAVSGAGPGDQNLSMQTFKDAANNGVKGEALYNYMPKGAREFVKSLIEGRATVTQRMQGNPQMLPFLEAANIIDPQFEVGNAQARAKGINDWQSTGPDAETTRKLNQALMHVAGEEGADKDPIKKGLTDYADELPGHMMAGANSLENAVRSKLLGQGHALGFEQKGHAVAVELGKLWKNTGQLSDAEIRAWEGKLSPNMSREQQQVAISSLMGLIQGAYQSLEDKRLKAVGGIMANKMGPLLSPSGQAAHNKIINWLQPSESSPAPTAATPPQSAKEQAGVKVVPSSEYFK